MSEAARVRAPRARAEASPAPAAPAHAPAASAAPARATVPAFPVLTLGGVQRKPVIGRPDDAYEVEADAVAARVAGGLDAPALGVSRLGAAGPAGPPQPGAVDQPVQAKEDDEPDEPPPAAAVQLLEADPGEDEPDADAVQLMEDEPEDEAAVQLKEEPEDEAAVQLKEDEEEPAVQMKGGGAGGMQEAAGAAIRSPGPGAPLPTGTRGTLESRMGVGLGGVRVHDGADAERSASRLNARAFTHGRHIWLGRGESASDVPLMAHEVTHVLQQDGVVRRKPAEKKKEAPPPSPPPSPPSPAPAPKDAAPPAPPAPKEPKTTEGATEAKKPAEGGGGAVEAAAEAASGEGAGGAGPELLMPEPPAGLSEEDREALESVDQRAGEAVEATTELPSADEQVGEAREAVEEPEAETSARAGDRLVDALGERQPPSPEIEALCDRIYEAIRSKRPPDEDSLVDADPAAMAQETGGELNASVEGEAQAVQGQYDELQETPEGTPEQVAQPMEEPPGPAETPDPAASEAVPEGVAAEDVSLDADVAAAEGRIDEAGMNSEPASLVETGPIAEARAAQGELAETAASDPQEVLAEQQSVLASADADMQGLQAAALAALQRSRVDTAAGGREQQTGMVGSEAEMRVAAAAEAQQIFADAQTRVTDLLEPLPRTAMAKWEAGVQVLSTRFEQHLERVRRWIEERHESSLSAAWDYFAGLPDWVTENYDRAEQNFGDGVCDLIREISSDVNGVIAACEAIVDDARTRIDAVFAALPEELQGWAAEQQAEFGGRLDGLNEQAQQTRSDFTRDLTQRASQAVQSVREQVHELREAAKGLLGRLEDAVNAFLEDPAKFIIDGLLSLVGISPAAFWAVVNRIGEAIDSIADDPMNFANNLMAALGQGFQQFFDNIGDHLLQGLLDWLFSGLGSVGVQLPADTSLKSIITFFLQLMGLSWANIRQILARHIGEENVALIEKAWELVSSLIEMGPEGLFEMIKEQLDPANLLQMVLDAAVDYLVQALIAAVTPRILLLFNPAGAIIQAIEAVYRVLKWIFENAARIFSLVETVVNGVTDLIAGNIGGMANAVEGALARLITPVIDFLAGYLGLGGLPEAIADVIRGFQTQVLAIVDRIIGFLAERAKGLLRAMGLGGEEEGSEEPPGDHESLAERAKQEMEQPAPEAQDYESLRIAKAAQAQQIEERYSGLLEAGIGLTVQLATASSDEADQDLDFTIVIAPNDTTTEGSVSAPVPEPVAGLHVVSRPAQFESVAGESHHVPAKGLGTGIARFLDSMAQALSSGEWDGDPDAQNLAAAYSARASANRAAARRPGNDLSAILLSSEAHTEEGGVHTIEGSGPVLSAIATNPGLDTIVVVKRKTATRIAGVTSYISVNPQIGSWRLFLADVRRALRDPGFRNDPAVPPDADDTVNEILAEAQREFMQAEERADDYLGARVVNPTNEILDRAVGDAYRSGKQTVSSAMERADDGTPAGRQAALSSLDSYYDSSWRQFRLPIIP